MHASQQQLHLNIFEGNTFYNAIAPSLNSMYKVSYTMLKEGIADLLIGVIEKSYWFWRIALQDQKFPIFWKVPIFFFFVKVIDVRKFISLFSKCLLILLTSNFAAAWHMRHKWEANQRAGNFEVAPLAHHQEMCAIL